MKYNFLHFTFGFHIDENFLKWTFCFPGEACEGAELLTYFTKSQITQFLCCFNADNNNNIRVYHACRVESSSLSSVMSCYVLKFVNRHEITRI